MLFFILLVPVLAIFIGSGIYFSDIVIHPRTRSHELTFQSECERGNLVISDFDTLPKEEVWIKSNYGYDLYGLYFPNGNSKNTVVICHGITYTIYGSVKYMDMFMKRGFNVLLYDHRNHGKSGGTNTTFGYYEKYDLMTCIDWVLGRYGSDCSIGVHGESMGAAIALQAAAIDPRIRFCVADCPFSDLAELLRYRLKLEYKLPFLPVIQLTRLFSWLRTGMLLAEISPIRDINGIAVPVFFIHGKEDRYIPTQMSIDMYNSKKGAKKLYIAPNARHAESVMMNREDYDRLVGEFLQEISPAPILHP